MKRLAYIVIAFVVLYAVYYFYVYGVYKGSEAPVEIKDPRPDDIKPDNKPDNSKTYSLESFLAKQPANSYTYYLSGYAGKTYDRANITRLIKQWLKDKKINKGDKIYTGKTYQSTKNLSSLIPNQYTLPTSTEYEKLPIFGSADKRADYLMQALNISTGTMIENDL